MKNILTYSQKIYHKPNFVMFSYRSDDITTATPFWLYENIIETAYDKHYCLRNKIYNIKLPDRFIYKYSLIRFERLLRDWKDYL